MRCWCWPPLVEAEAKRDDERATIAGVYLNRLHTPGWRLDCDATLIYARQERVKRLFDADKIIASPYNTYQRFGLPPGPIDNPGLKILSGRIASEKGGLLFLLCTGRWLAHLLPDTAGADAEYSSYRARAEITATCCTSPYGRNKRSMDKRGLR